MSTKQPLDSLTILRHRFGRTNEVWKAYQVFWERQLNIGEGFICQSEQEASNITHTLLIAYFSYVYSLFDDSACHFIEDTESLSDLTPVAIEAREHIIKLWGIMKNPIQRLRHGAGFHGGKNMKSLLDGYKQINERHINLAMVDCLMLFMESFFRELSNIYSFKESYFLRKGTEYSRELSVLALDVEEAILLRGFGHDFNLTANAE